MPSTALSIRPIDSGALSELRPLAIQTFTESFAAYNTASDMQAYLNQAFSSSTLREELGAPRSYWFLAYLKGQPVAYLKLNEASAPLPHPTPYGLEVERIYVLQEAQGQGVGQALFDKALHMAQKLGLRELWLGVWEHNEGAIRFYQRNGCLQFGRKPFQLGLDLQTDFLMKRSVPLGTGASPAIQELLDTVVQASISLTSLDPTELRTKPAPDRWSPKEVLGHLIDSAYHNQLRFGQAAQWSEWVFDGYEQDAWVRINGYQHRPFPDLLASWVMINRQLIELLLRLPVALWERPRSTHNFHQICMRPCSPGQAVSLSYLLEDYVYHLKHHLRQLLPAEPWLD